MVGGRRPLPPKTSNLARSWGLPTTVIKSHAEEKGAWPWTRGAPQILEVPFNIYTVAEASDFKFATQLGFAKAHHKIHNQR